MSIKVTICLGELEVDYEGSEEFLKYELVNIISELAEIDIAPVGYSEQFDIEDDNEPDEVVSVSPSKFEMTTTTVASRLKAKSGRDLVVAACAHLTIVEGVEKMSRSAILKDMQTATGYYKSSYSNNLSKSLMSLIKLGRLIQVANDTYTLSAETRKNLEAKIA